VLIVPLVLVLIVASDKTTVGKMQEWKRDHLPRVRLVAGIAMVALGALILII